MYYTDSSYSTVLKTSTDEGGVADTAVVKSGANGYRLPTEAEWECAARGGDPDAAEWNNKYAGTEGSLDAYAWYSLNALNVGESDPNYGVHPVGKKTQNGAGLYDMSGNVWEWCWDWNDTITTATATDPAGAASGSCRVDRGGGWDLDAVDCTVATRSDGWPSDRDHDIGFRVVCR